MGETRRRTRPMSAPGRPAAAAGLGSAWAGPPPAGPPADTSGELVEVTLGRPAGPAFAPPSHVPTLSTFSAGRPGSLERARGRLSGHQRAQSQPAPPPRTTVSERQTPPRTLSEGEGPLQPPPGEPTPRRTLSDRQAAPRTLADRQAPFRTLPERQGRPRTLSEGQTASRRTLSAERGPAWERLEQRFDEAAAGVDLLVPPEYSIRLVDEPLRYGGPESGRPLLERGDSPGGAQPPDPFQDEDQHDPFAPDVGGDQGYAADDEYEEQTVKQMLRSLQRQLTTMSRNLSAKLDSIQSDRYMETSAQLKLIRAQLRELTDSVVNCQSEVSEVRKDVHMIRHEIDQLQTAKVEMEELRECVERLEEEQRRRKARSVDQGLTAFLVASIFSAVLGMFQFGYNTGVINAPQKKIEDFITNVWLERYGEEVSESTLDLLWSVAVSIFAIGGMVGGFSGGYVANRFGRKGGLLMNDVIGILGAALMGFSSMAESYELLIVGRLVIGYNCGMSSALVPMYVSEIAPVNLRGGVGIVNQLAVTIGMLLSQILGLSQLLGTSDGWPLLLGLAVCPSALQLVLLPMCPESPRYLLITKQREQDARKALRKLRHGSGIEDDVEEMKAEDRAQRAESSFTMLQLITSPALRTPLIIAIVMQLSQQLSGINAVFYYSFDIFLDAHLSEESAGYATMGVGVVMVVMTGVSILLIEREGRRTLHLWGLGGMFFFSVFITITFLVKQMISWISYLSVVCTFGFVVFFAVGPGSIPWMITAELFSQGPRPAAMSIAVLVNWFCNFIVGIVFLPMKNALEDYTFLPFSALLAIFWGFTLKMVPETKGKTFEEIASLFRRSEPGSELMLDEDGFRPITDGSQPAAAVRFGEPPLLEARYVPASRNSGPEQASLHLSLERRHGCGGGAGRLGPRLVDRRSLQHLERLEMERLAPARTT